MEPLYAVVRRQIAEEAIAQGMDASQAALAWDACTRHIASIPMLAPQPGETREQKRQRRIAVRRQRAELQKVATFALGATLLTLLFNWALARLVNWVVDRVLDHAETATYGDWQSAFPEPHVHAFASLLPAPLPWQMRLFWAIYSIASRFVLR